MATKITHQDVLAYFESASPDTVDLVLSIVLERRKAAEARRELQVRSLAKARAAKGKGTVVAVTGTAPKKRGRPFSKNAPPSAASTVTPGVTAEGYAEAGGDANDVASEGRAVSA